MLALSPRCLLQNAVALVCAALVTAACLAPEPFEPDPTDPTPVDPVLPDPTPREPLDRVDLSALAPEAYGVEGVAVDADGGVLVLLSGQGLLTLNASGELVSTRDFYTEGFDDYGYSDLDVLPDGRIALAAPNEVVVYDAATQLVSSYFCLEPGFEEIVMVNQSVAVDVANDRVFAAPVFYDSTIGFTNPETAFHSRYSIDGAFISQVDVRSTTVVAEGLAFDTTRDRLLAVDGDTLSIFRGDGSVERSVLLSGITDASGLAIDAVGGHLYVTDRADLELRRYALDEI
jgi:DNA-binding beta-propeller fold protein YncE